MLPCRSVTASASKIIATQAMQGRQAVGDDANCLIEISGCAYPRQFLLPVRRKSDRERCAHYLCWRSFCSSSWAVRNASGTASSRAFGIGSPLISCRAIHPHPPESLEPWRSRLRSVLRAKVKANARRLTAENQGQVAVDARRGSKFVQPKVAPSRLFGASPHPAAGVARSDDRVHRAAYHRKRVWRVRSSFLDRHGLSARDHRCKSNLWQARRSLWAKGRASVGGRSVSHRLRVVWSQQKHGRTDRLPRHSGPRRRGPHSVRDGCRRGRDFAERPRPLSGHLWSRLWGIHGCRTTYRWLLRREFILALDFLRQSTPWNFSVHRAGLGLPQQDQKARRWNRFPRRFSARSNTDRTRALHQPRRHGPSLDIGGRDRSCRIVAVGVDGLPVRRKQSE